MAKIKEFLSGPAKELVRKPSVRRLGQLIAQNATSPVEIERLISAWKHVDRSCLIAEDVAPTGVVNEVLIGVAEGLVVHEPRVADIAKLFPMLSEVRRLRFADAEWLGRVAAELDGFASAMFAHGQAVTPLVRAARAVSMSIADNPALLAAIIDALEHVLHEVAPEIIAHSRLLLSQEVNLLNDRARAVSETEGFSGLVGAAGIRNNCLISKVGIEAKNEGWFIDLDAYHLIQLSAESCNLLCGWLRRGRGMSNVDLDEAANAESAGSPYERLALLHDILTDEMFKKASVTKNEVTSHFVDHSGRSWFNQSSGWLQDVDDSDEMPHPCIGFARVSYLIDWDGAIEYTDLNSEESSILTNAVLGMLAWGISSVADALTGVHFLLEVLGPSHTIRSFVHFDEVIRSRSNQLPVLTELIQSTDRIGNLLGYTKAKQCASLRSLVSVRVEGQKVVRLVVHEGRRGKDRAAEFNFNGFPEEIAERIREYLESIPDSSPGNRPSPTKCESLVHALGKLLELVLREFYVPYIKLSESRLQELGIELRPNWEQSSKVIVLCLAKLKSSSISSGAVETIQSSGVTAEEIKLLFDAVDLRNRASHADARRRSIGWRDVVRMEEILLDGDLLRRLVVARIGAGTKES